MASWIIHLRVADALLDGLCADASQFVAGNIAPDCGAVREDGSFEPDMHVTHFTETGKGECEYERFYEEFAAPERDPLRRAFYLGYYCHLMTDVLWAQRINAPTKERFRRLYLSDREDYYRRVKKDWYDLDFCYLKQNPHLRAWKIFCGLENFENTCLPFYKRDNLRMQFAHIRDFYTGKGDTEREFPYLAPERADAFVAQAAVEIRRNAASHFSDLCKMTEEFV